MGKRTTRRPGRRAESQRPSLFFMIALALGMILLVWLFVLALSRPMVPQPLEKKRSAQRGESSVVAMHSISTRAPNARPFAPSALRAGYGFEKYVT